MAQEGKCSKFLIKIQRKLLKTLKTIIKMGKKVILKLNYTMLRNVFILRKGYLRL